MFLGGKPADDEIVEMPRPRQPRPKEAARAGVKVFHLHCSAAVVGGF